jgi:hypothetical protein
MKKHPHTKLSSTKCLRCSKLIKQNLIDRKPDAGLCYKCHRISTGKPSYHQPRRKRIEAELPVHNYNK